MLRPVKILGKEFELTDLEKLFRERILKISEDQMAILSDVRIEDIVDHEAGGPHTYYDDVAKHMRIHASYIYAGMDAWFDRLQESEMYVDMVADMLDPTSREEYMTTDQMTKIGIKVVAA